MAAWARAYPGELPDLTPLEQAELVHYVEDLEQDVADLRRDLLFTARLDSLDRAHLVELHALEVRGYEERRPSTIEQLVTNPVVVFLAGYLAAAWVTRGVLD